MGLPAASCITPMRVTGTWLTVTVQLALTSGLLLEVAVIRQVPALTAVTLPAASTVAMLSSLEVQVTPWFRAVQGCTTAARLVLLPFHMSMEVLESMMLSAFSAGSAHAPLGP
ncbi:unknown [Firmicutes bacterium CAG:137]|nr:unknown [Firmicutes bacterium CAG:137]